MLELTQEQVLRACPDARAARIAAVLPYLNAGMAEAQVDTPLRAAMWLAQLGVESTDFAHFEENLNYSAGGLLKTFSKYFKSAQLAEAYAHQPQRIANRVYADRLGNGDEQSGDGWRHRGRGAIQLTGFEAYHRLSIETGIDFVGQPDLLIEPKYAFVAAAHFWRWKGVNVAADKGDVDDGTHRVNGGSNGLLQRHLKYDRACEVLGVLNLNLVTAKGNA